MASASDTKAERKGEFRRGVHDLGICFRHGGFPQRVPETGVRDQLDGRNYGTGFWEAQWLGFSRLKQHFWPR